MASEKKRNPPRRLTVLRFSSLGDVAMLYPVLKTLTETHPDVEVEVVSRPFFEPVFRYLLRVRFRAADVEGRYKGIAGLRRLYEELHRAGPDAVADLHDVLRTKFLRFLFRMGGIPVYTIDKGRMEKRRLIRQPLAKARPLRSTHERYADVFRRMGLPLDLSDFRPELPPLNRQVELFLAPFAEVPVLGIAPLAKHPGKQYPLGGMKEVIRQVTEALPQVHIFLFGAPDEKKLLDYLVTEPSRVFNLAGMFPFDEELQIISRLKMMLAMDSGNGHLAANYGVPVITVWGITHPYAGFSPFGQDETYRILPDTEKFPMLPCSVYGNKICRGYEKIWDDVLPEHISAKVVEKFKER